MTSGVVMPGFTLQPPGWYALECISPDGGRHYSPIWLKAIHPQGGGQRRLDLEFYHANYPEGVRDKRYLLTVLRRAPGYVLAEESAPAATDRRLILLGPLTFDWLRYHFPELPITATDGDAFAAELDRLTARVSQPSDS